jgi:hypothetical protein
MECLFCRQLRSNGKIIKTLELKILLECLWVQLEVSILTGVGAPLPMDYMGAPFPGPMPYMGYPPGPFDPFGGGILPQDPFMPPGFMMPGVPRYIF